MITKYFYFPGHGDFYSSGNNLKALMGSVSDDVEGAIKRSTTVLRNMIKAFYSFPKLLLAVVNGPCIGITATTVALCDVIYCSKTAYFHTPFSLLGLCAEGCSSYTFPRILGKSKANEMLLLNYKLSADEARQNNFVSEVYETQEVDKIWAKIDEFANLPMGSLEATKHLVKRFEVEDLEKANNAEIEELQKRFMSEEAIEAIINFSTRKSKF